MTKALFALPMLFAAQLAQAVDNSLYGGAGTEGLTLGYSHIITPRVGLRGEVNHYKASTTRNTGSLNIDADAKLGGQGLYLDFFPTAGMFRISAGAVHVNTRLDGTARPANGALVINGTSYAVSPGDSLTGTGRFGNVRPYLGIGIGHHGREEKGWSGYADVGVNFLSPKARLTANGNLANSVAASDLAAEQARFQDNLDKLRAYPVIKLGIAWHF